MKSGEIKLSKLRPAPENPRKSMNPLAIEELKASILAHGLLQSLLVAEAGFGEFEVISGTRRLIALKELQDEGKLPKNHAVLCQVIDRPDRMELSLAENVVREAMHPADEFEAFNGLVKKGEKIPDIAHRFGVTEKHVRGRLKMARLHPDIVKAYREREINLDQLMAFTVSEDQEKQLKVLKEMRGWNDEPEEIRGSLMENKIDGDDKLVKFVGLEEYKAAGGGYSENLFGDEIWCDDPALLATLAERKLKAVAEKLEEEGWGWVTILPRGSIHEYTRGMAWVGENEWPKKDKRGHMGCCVTIGYNGEPEIHKAYIRKEDIKALRKEKPELAEGVTLPAGREKGALPEGLKRCLAADRRTVMQLALAKHPGIAIDLMICNAVCDLLANENYGNAPDITFHDHRGFFSGKIPPENIRQIEMIEKGLPLEWMKEKDPAERFGKFQLLPEADKKALLAFCIAVSQDYTFSPVIEPDDLTEMALQQTGVSVADYWRPTADNYMGSITREQLIALGGEIFGDAWAAKWKSAKKGELVAELDKAFADPAAVAGLDTNLEHCLRTWLPAGMTFGSPAKPGKKKRAA